MERERAERRVIDIERAGGAVRAAVRGRAEAERGEVARKRLAPRAFHNVFEFKVAACKVTKGLMTLTVLKIAQSMFHTRYEHE